ncbi:7-deoxyloganetin glucosyltransferase-like [Glycine soja]|uniref:Glycosyltransferase n=1 Tax=Glycine soja TaxID=3848 RepID=A0A445GXF1_GLYSO|nr:7-deoxyloganetin glucosyltransferase-like [Glycine soja]RZB65945.1 7-deoxyloganetin glucosyltransferase [Glycine soja]
MEKLHAVCIPYPAQGHINPMLKLAKLLHVRGFHITFVNTEYNHKRLLKSRGSDSLNSVPSFQFETIPDGLSDNPDVDATQDVVSLSESTRRTCLTPFKNLLSKLNSASDTPPVTCIVSDSGMSFTLDAAQELGIPDVILSTASACGYMCYMKYPRLVDMGLTHLKDSSYLENSIDWVPGIKEIRLKDLPSFMRTTNPQDLMMMDFIYSQCERAQKASAIIVNTFDALEHDVLDAFSSILLPPIYSIGPLNLLLNNDVTNNEELKTIGSNLWKEEPKCLEWLNSKEPNSVVYVNFGSIMVMTSDQLTELAWGLANSNKNFLWVIRPDLVVGEINCALPNEFVKETKDRGMLASWCPQEEVLAHPAVGGFLTHCGWNSTLESVCEGVPMLCWPFFAEQQTNCRFCCKEWGIGLEIEDVKREKVEALVRELMEGEKGKEMKERALEWKKLAHEAASSPHGSSFVNMDNVVRQVLMNKIATK